MTRLREDHRDHDHDHNHDHDHDHDHEHDQGNKERDNETILSILNPAEQETNNASTVNNSNEHAKLPQYNSNLNKRYFLRFFKVKHVSLRPILSEKSRILSQF